METLAGITLYEPDVHRLLENIDAVLPQVDKLICVDNGSKNIAEIKDRIHWKYPDVEIIENGENLGIARALNQMFEYAEAHVYDWVLTLDQDSVCPENLMEEYKKHLEIKDVGVLSPKMVDRNFEKEIETEKPYDYIDKCINDNYLDDFEGYISLPSNKIKLDIKLGLKMNSNNRRKAFCKL